MKRALMLAAAFALLGAAPALAAKGGPPYKLDVKGKCHDSSGAMTVQTNCAKSASTPMAPAKPATPAKPVVVATKSASTKGAPNCKPGNKPCGKICISASKTCHV